MILTSKEFHELIEFERWLANDCGGCETCDREFFGSRDLKRDSFELYQLINTIRHLDKEVQALRTVAEGAGVILAPREEDYSIGEEV